MHLWKLNTPYTRCETEGWCNHPQSPRNIGHCTACLGSYSACSTESASDLGRLCCRIPGDLDLLSRQNGIVPRPCSTGVACSTLRADRTRRRLGAPMGGMLWSYTTFSSPLGFALRHFQRHSTPLKAEVIAQPSSYMCQTCFCLLGKARTPWNNDQSLSCQPMLPASCDRARRIAG